MGLFGGGNSSNTDYNTTNNYDQRQVITNTTSYSSYDLSDRSTKNTFNDFSNRSTNISNSSTYWDNSSRVDSHNVTNNDLSNRSVTTNNIDNSNRSVTNNDLSNRSVTNIDNSNRSVNTTTTLWDSSSHDVTNIDNSNRSVNTTNTTNNYLDAGAVSGGLKVAGDSVSAMLQTVMQSLGLASSVTAQQAAQTAHAYDYADNVFHASLDAVNQNDARMLDAFTRAAAMENDALTMAQTSAKTALDQVQNAYADAKGTTQAQQKIMLAVLAVAAVAVLAIGMRK